MFQFDFLALAQCRTLFPLARTWSHSYDRLRLHSWWIFPFDYLLAPTNFPLNIFSRMTGTSPASTTIVLRRCTPSDTRDMSLGNSLIEWTGFGSGAEDLLEVSLLGMK